MVIMHILTRLLKAGSEENTLISCQAQVSAGHKVIIVHGAEYDLSMRKRAEHLGVQVLSVETMVHQISPYFDLKAVLDIKAVISRIRPDVVHTHQSKAGILGRIAAALSNTQIIVHGVHILNFENVGAARKCIYVTLERICANFTNSFICVSPFLRDASLREKIGSSDKYFVAYSAMDIESFRTANEPADWRNILKVAEKKEKPLTIVMLAAFEPRKRHLELISCLPVIFENIPEWRILFAGEGELLQKAIDLVDSLSLADKVFFAGYREDPQSIIALADVCLLTSMREGLPRVAVQYVAAGKPTVANHLPGIEDILVNGINAIVVEPDDVRAAAAAAAQLLARREKREELAAGAKRTCLDAWDPEKMAMAISQAYEYSGKK